MSRAMKDRILRLSILLACGFVTSSNAFLTNPVMLGRTRMRGPQEALSVTTFNDVVNGASYRNITDPQVELIATPTNGVVNGASVPKITASERSLAVESVKVMDILIRANELQSMGREIIHCEVGQPGSGAPPSVARAATEALTKSSIMGYTDAFGLLPLREKIAEHYTKQYGYVDGSTVDASEMPITKRIIVTTGSSGACLLAFTACFDAGDVVAIASSGYPCYRNILGALGCEVASVPVNREFKLTAVELKAEIRRRKAAKEAPLKGLVLSSPSNPTGAMLTPEELKDLCELCDKEGIQFLSDEIYHGISYGTVAEDTALKYSKNAIVINSFSKYYSMAGWRLGWMVIPDYLVEPVLKLQQSMFINAPTISQTAALKCFDDDTIAELEGHVENYRAARKVILDELAAIPDIDPSNIAPSDGSFYLYVDLGDENVAKKGNLGSVAMCKALLEEQGVAFTPGIDFEDPLGNLGERRFRISYAGGVETARKAMEKFRCFWPSWLERVKAAQ